MKKILIALENDGVNDNMGKVRNALQKMLGDFTPMEVVDSLSAYKESTKNNFDLYLIEGCIWAKKQEEFLQVIPHEKLIVLNVDGMLHEELNKMQILSDKGSFMDHRIKKMQPQIEEILTVKQQ